ncbi:MAG: hypothetical protein U0797_15115 [Gemmataceae bacterium]
MIYTVVWVPSARARLATLWTQAADRQAIADSADRIDEELREDADAKGIPFGHFRAYYDDPLGVMYNVDPGDCKVTVMAVKLIV